MKLRSRLAMGSAALLGCGSPTAMDLGPHVPSTLTETQAHLVIEQTLAGAGIVRQGRPAELEDVGHTEVDFVFWQPPHGIEWLTRADLREKPQAQWPRTGAGSPLQVIKGTLPEGSSVYVLVLDEQSYLYESNPRWVQRGAPGIESAEERVRKDVEDFLQYVRSQDAPLGGTGSP